MWKGIVLRLPPPLTGSRRASLMSSIATMIFWTIAREPCIASTKKTKNTYCRWRGYSNSVRLRLRLWNMARREVIYEGIVLQGWVYVVNILAVPWLDIPLRYHIQTRAITLNDISIILRFFTPEQDYIPLFQQLQIGTFSKSLSGPESIRLPSSSRWTTSNV